MNNVYGVTKYGDYSALAMFIVSAGSETEAYEIVKSSEEYHVFLAGAGCEDDLDVGDVNGEPYGITSQPSGIIDYNFTFE